MESCLKACNHCIVYTCDPYLQTEDLLLPSILFLRLRSEEALARAEPDECIQEMVGRR